VAAVKLGAATKTEIEGIVPGVALLPAAGTGATRYSLRPPRRRRRRAATRPGARFVRSAFSRQLSSQYRVTPSSNTSLQLRHRSGLIVRLSPSRRKTALHA
jgi:hypothetical protein